MTRSGAGNDVAGRVRARLAALDGVTERRMFGGLAFMVAGHLLCAVGDDHLLVRVGPDGYDDALRRPHATAMCLTGRTMRGWVTVEPAGHRSPRDLDRWITTALAFVSALPPKRIST